MPGYLLDTNHVGALASRQPKIVQKYASIHRNVQIRACVITLGEIEAGHQMTQSTDPKKRNDYTKFVNREFVPNALGITASTRFHYADVMGRLWKKYPPQSGQKTERYLVLKFGVDINDVWTVAVAIEHGLTLVTQDKMATIQGVVPELDIENWLA